jgi:tRNA-specific 2-thiouridylase
MSEKPSAPAANRVLVAMSGGVDSSVAALLLRDAGCEVVGVFMRNGVAAEGEGASRSCCSASDSRDAARVAARLGVPFYAVDYAAEFGAIVDHFVAEYRRGRTPNPCVLCNRDLKFGRVLELADGVGAAEVATGHYARQIDGRLFRARDPDKDQSYYLFGIEREALPRVRFPLGELTKAEVRALAREAGLATADKPDSMEICFVTSGDYRDVVRERGGAGKSGAFVDPDGRVLGTHGGVGLFTVGQRRGLPALGEPRFVQAIRPDSGDVVLARRAELAARTALVRGVNWLVDPPHRGVGCGIKIRARAAPIPGRVDLEPADPSVVRVRFDEDAFAVTPGQAAVFYDGDLVLGGGFLD